MSFEFVVNLRAETSRPQVRALWQPAGWLLSPAYASRGLRQVALQASQARQTVVVDNGNYPLIEDSADALEAVATAPRDILAAAIRPRAAQAVANEPARRAFQLQSGATRLIGAEELGPAIAAKLGRSDTFTRADIRDLNQRTTRRAVQQIQTVPAPITYLAVATARDYRTAYDAGTVFARAGLTGVAIGLGAAMNDRRDTTQTDALGTPTTLTRPLPARYVRSGEILRGFMDGYRQIAGRPPRDFHYLGLGAPIMLALAALFGYGVGELTADATSPIRDAFAGSVYVWEPTPLKVDAINEARRLLSYRTARWRCTCAFCRWYLAQYPFDLDAARTWAAQSGRQIAETDLRTNGALQSLLPLLALSATGPTGRDTRLARVGHNHVVLDRITKRATRARTRSGLTQWLEPVIDRYRRASRTDKYAEAVQLNYDWARAPT